MLLENKNYGESGYMVRSFLAAPMSMQQKCMDVQQSIVDGDFDTYEEALSAYNVSDSDYKLLHEKSSRKQASNPVKVSHPGGAYKLS